MFVGQKTNHRDFSILELKALACEDDPRSVDSIRDLCGKFLEEHGHSLTQLNPHRLLNLGGQLSQLTLHDSVCRLLKPVLPESDFCVKS